jgi:hypothetical protein
MRLEYAVGNDRVHDDVACDVAICQLTGTPRPPGGYPLGLKGLCRQRGACGHRQSGQQGLMVLVPRQVRRSSDPPRNGRCCSARLAPSEPARAARVPFLDVEGRRREPAQSVGHEG